MNTESSPPPISNQEESSAALHEAIALHQAGRLLAAEQCYLSILKSHPNHPEANHNLGVLALQSMRAADSLPYFITALDNDPENGQTWLNYIDALFQAGQIDDARQILLLAKQQGLHGGRADALTAQLTDNTTKEVSAAPMPVIAPTSNAPANKEIDALIVLFNKGHFAEALLLANKMTGDFPLHEFGWKALGTIFQKLNRSSDALAPLQKTIELLPDDAQAHNNLGMILQDLGRFDESMHSYHRAIQIKPEYAEAYINLGTLLHEMRRFNEAEACYRSALQIEPDSPVAHFNLGNALREQDQLSDAETSYRKALKISADYADAHNNLGVTLRDMHRLTDAETSFRRALKINSKLSSAYSNLGLTLMEMGRLIDAEACHRKALEIDPNIAEIHANLGNTLKDLCRLDEAHACYQKALQIKPDYENAFSNLLFVLNYHPDKNAGEIFKFYREYDTKFGQLYRNEWHPHDNSRETTRRLKIGYVSPDFNNHSAKNFLAPLLSNHNKNVVELYAYAELTHEDQVTSYYKKQVDYWIPTRGLSDEELAKHIRADKIDILVDLAGHSAKNRLGVFARKPAPVSVSWLGYGYTTGLSAIDYFLTDAISTPGDSDGLFSEKPLRIAPHSYCYRPVAGMGEVSPLPAQQRAYVTFGTLTRSVRINHRTIRVWSEILKQVKNSRLVIDSGNFKDSMMQEQLAAKFAVHGISRNRLQIAYTSPPWDVLRGIDIGLDCFPHNSGTTLFETLYMGVPYVTLAGRPSVGRLGSSILQAIGHPEWIATSEDEYVKKAVALAENLPELAELRAGLRQNMQRGTLMNEAAFAGKIEIAYQTIFEKWANE